VPALPPVSIPGRRRSPFIAIPSPDSASLASIFSVRNVRLFILLKIFFNARFYYPIFTILFLDFGLTMAQFALLNAVWAATIVVMEVPSGALADVIGRRKLLVASGVLMVLEMALLVFAPRNHPQWTLGLFLLNRILSGMAEAMASGADEAIAYDALKQAGREADWPRVLELQMRCQAIAYIVALSLGAAVYDPRLMQAAADFLGCQYQFTQAVTLRIPLAMTFLMSLGTLAIVLRFEEAGNTPRQKNNASAPGFQDLQQALALTLRAGSWIWHHGFARAIILGGLLFDSFGRMVITLSSQYYRMVQVPEALFGVIGSVLALSGIFIPRVARRMVNRFSPRTNVLVTGVLILIGMSGMSGFFPYWGLLPAFMVSGSMYLTSFFISRYLNQVTESSQRATVLSFKGLFYNLAYGLVGLGYSVMLAVYRGSLPGDFTAPGTGSVEDFLYMHTFVVFPGCFLLGLILLSILIRRVLATRHEH